MNSNRNPRDNRDLYETPWCKAGWKVTFNMLTTFPLCPRKKTKRPTEKGCAPPTDEPNCYICLRFFDVVLRHFLLWLSLMPHACHVEAYRVTCVYIFSTLFYVFLGGVPFARLRSLARNALDRLLRPKQVDLCAVSGASPVGNEALLAVDPTLGTNPSEAGSPSLPDFQLLSAALCAVGWRSKTAVAFCQGAPQSNQTCWPQSMSATKKRSLPEDRSSTKAWNPEKHCF